MRSSHKTIILGHRGARGLFPENTLTGFIETIKLGVYTLEMDVVISKDLKVVVSHEAWMNDLFCSQPNGNPVENNSKEKYNLYKMNYAEIAKFDCGARRNINFPLQKSIPEHKPLLSEVIKVVEEYQNANQLPEIIYLIEIKTEIEEDNIFQPGPSVFVKLVNEVINKNKIQDQVQLQSFDVRILQEIKKQGIPIKIGLLIENNDDIKTNLDRLGFVPDMYNPDFSLLTPEIVKELHALNIEVNAWTVNEISDIKKLISFGVDGIITDYPNVALELIESV